MEKEYSKDKAPEDMLSKPKTKEEIKAVEKAVEKCLPPNPKLDYTVKSLDSELLSELKQLNTNIKKVLDKAEFPSMHYLASNDILQKHITVVTLDSRSYTGVVKHFSDKFFVISNSDGEILIHSNSVCTIKY